MLPLRSSCCPSSSPSRHCSISSLPRHGRASPSFIGQPASHYGRRHRCLRDTRTLSIVPPQFLLSSTHLCPLPSSAPAFRCFATANVKKMPFYSYSLYSLFALGSLWF